MRWYRVETTHQGQGRLRTGHDRFYNTRPRRVQGRRGSLSYPIRVAAWHLELLSGGQGRDEDLTASG